MNVPKLTPEMTAEFPPAAVDLIQRLLTMIQLQAAKIAELEEKLNKNSRNSSKPPRATARPSSPRHPESNATRNRPMRVKIFANNVRMTATPAGWKMTYLAWMTNLALNTSGIQHFVAHSSDPQHDSPDRYEHREGNFGMNSLFGRIVWRHDNFLLDHDRGSLLFALHANIG